MIQEIMNTSQIKKELHSYIDKADDRFLKMVQALAKSYEVEEEDYTLPGHPMDVETYRNRILKASDRVKAGYYTTQEELEKEIEK